ncbi:TolC family protein [Psychromonas aquimarina]|uniref:TolC family protein n=1 Tax=Psychromonas aquimarina TaxID=444919 RepID=UPI00041C915A|nr:TolC family protein [Psychromonas aquimarina]
MNVRKYFFLSLTLLLSFKLAAQGFLLSEAEHMAVNSDPAQKIYQAQQSALRAQGVSASTLADPMIKLGMANIPTDSFQLDQDPMTQLSVGLSQQFSRGSQLELARKGFNQQSETAVYAAVDRQLTVKKTVRELWFSILFVEKSKELVAENKKLFSGFYNDLQSQFSLGLADNEDLIAAEIELSRYDEKSALLTQQSLNYRTLLSEWIGQNAYGRLAADIPEWRDTLAYIEAGKGAEQHYQLLSSHPQVKMLAQNILVADNNIKLAEQDYKPSFKVEVGYGHRLSEMDDGMARPDLLSGFVSMDIPLFTDKRQDQKMISAQQIKGQKQAEHRLLLRQLNALLDAQIINYQQLAARQLRYKETLLKQAKLQSRLLEQSYQSNTRPFKEVIQAYINEQNLSIEYQQLYFDGLKSLSQIRYFQAL